MRGPIETVDELVQAINTADLERAVATYESDAAFVAQPGQIVRGTMQVREALNGFMAIRPTLRTEARQLIEGEGMALYIGRWSLTGTDPAGKAVAMSGESTDVLRRQSDGRWLIALDNPWGVQVLPSR